ncbi:MAG: c-type cytochrome [Actinomycetota bacterium]
MKQRHLVFKSTVLAAIITIFVIATATPLALGAATEDNGESVLQSKCLGCHSIGGGDTDTGPDLMSVASKRTDAWLEDIIEDPDKLVSSGDPQMAELLAKYNGKKMPKLGLSDEEVSSVVLYLKSKKLAEGVVAGPKLPPGDSGRGKALYVGESRLTNGGTACIACHNAGSIGPSGTGPLGGGVLAKDLTDVYTRYKENRLASALNTLQFPLMTDIYKDRQLTDQEKADLVAFFKKVSEEQPASHTTTLIIFALTGIGGFLIILLISQLVWGKRIHGVRKQLVGGSK